jgi:hypothetical protein
MFRLPPDIADMLLAGSRKSGIDKVLMSYSPLSTSFKPTDFSHQSSLFPLRRRLLGQNRPSSDAKILISTR